MRVLLLLSLLPAPAFAVEAIILGGGKTASVATETVAAFKAPADLTVSAGFPKLMNSSNVKGLKPGFHVAILGFCSDRRAAQKVARLFKGAYTRTVQGQDPKTCPVITSPAPPMDPRETALLDRLKKDPKSEAALYDYGVYLKEEARFDEAQEQLNKLLEINPSHQGAKDLLQVIMVLTTD
ncbi:MAG TPA: hypothetical protein VFA20_01735 [Myxococcaceae bacterium]|nr:hypothetical protein [Myxococcaceae bacterium]